MSHPGHTPTPTYTHTHKHVHTTQMESPELSPCSVCPGSKAKRRSQLLSILTTCWVAFRPLSWRSVCANLLLRIWNFSCACSDFLLYLSLPFSSSQMDPGPSPCAGPVCWLLASQHPALPTSWNCRTRSYGVGIAPSVVSGSPSRQPCSMRSTVLLLTLAGLWWSRGGAVTPATSGADSLASSCTGLRATGIWSIDFKMNKCFSFDGIKN